MIQHTSHAWHARPWQQELAEAVRDPRELCELLALDPDLFPATYAAHGEFALRVPRPYLARMRRGDPDDPLLRQIMPLGKELISVPGYDRDPLGETDANPIPGLIHKYRSRVLLIVSPVCAINCRYCFRRHFAYEENRPTRSQWQPALDYIAARPEINEVIYSGGDPLATNDRQLRHLTTQVAAIAHVKRLRVHTRLPVVIPSRIDAACIEWLTSTRLTPVMVLHINHPNEIDDEVRDAVTQLKNAGVTVLNQSVLLTGVNDSEQILVHLSEKLFAAGILPYYLHLLDRVTGAAHFNVALPKARTLYQAMLAALPGYLVPRLVREDPGAASKTPWA